MFVEIHLLQNFALSNLNRDDTGAPKNCIFGGTRRARISSQCQKRAIREYMYATGFVTLEQFSYRTRKLATELAARLRDVAGVDIQQATDVAVTAIELMGFELKDMRTEYLLMVGESELQRLVQICSENWTQLVELADKAETQAKAKKKNKNDSLGKILLSALQGGDIVDLALFGRMIADHPIKNVDAAVQMSHAFSTHAVANEFDYYTAVDDLRDASDDEGVGAAMLGTILYNSSCYYRYANLDLDQLISNLHGDLDTAIHVAHAFLEGMVKAVPTGKQNNSAAQNPPSLIMVVVRERGLWSLANAFTNAIWGANKDLLATSASQLLSHWRQLTSIYGKEGIEYVGLSTYLPLAEHGMDGISLETSFPDLQQQVLRVLRNSQN